MKRGETCACDWPGCQGQCHTGSTCPCHPGMTPRQHFHVWVGGAIAVLFGYLFLVVLFTSAD